MSWVKNNRKWRKEDLNKPSTWTIIWLMQIRLRQSCPCSSSCVMPAVYMTSCFIYLPPDLMLGNQEVQEDLSVIDEQKASAEMGRDVWDGVDEEDITQRIQQCSRLLLPKTEGQALPRRMGSYRLWLRVSLHCNLLHPLFLSSFDGQLVKTRGT